MRQRIFIIAMENVGDMRDNVLKNYLHRAIKNYYNHDEQEPFEYTSMPKVVLLEEMQASYTGSMDEKIFKASLELDQVVKYFEVLERLGARANELDIL